MKISNEMQYDIKEICTVPPPYGGVTTYVKRLIERLTSDGLKVGAYYSDLCNDDNIKKSPMFDRWTWMQTSLFPIKVWKYMKECRPYQIVHSHFSLEGMAYLWFIKTIGKKKIIVTVHNSMNDAYWRTSNSVNRFFLKLMLESKDVTWITVSEQGKQQLLSFPVKMATVIKVIPPYVPVKFNELTLLSKSLEQYLHCHKKIITFYGHSFMLNNGKDVYGFEDAVRMYANVRKFNNDIGMVLCIATVDNISALQRLQHIAQELNVNDAIYWQLGAIDNIQSLWQRTDVYVRPTSTDGDSVAVREVLDCGVNVVASDVCIRPVGVVCYRYGDHYDFVAKVTSSLKKTRRQPKQNIEPYTQMKDVYINILLRGTIPNKE